MNECKRVRTRLGETQIEFAERLSVSQSTISRWEGGKLPLSPRDIMALQHVAHTGKDTQESIA